MAAQSELYRDIATRTGGDIYIGVVGPGAHRQIHPHQAFYGNDGAAPASKASPAAAGPPMSCRNRQPGAPL